MSEYRVDELARAAGISVEVLRSYQSKGLLPPPRHEGRLALYGEGHLQRLKAIRDLKTRGHSLRAVASMLSEGERRTPGADAVLAGEQETFTLMELAERTRVPPAMLRSFEASGVLRPYRSGEERRYTPADVRAVRMLLALVGGGVPIEEFMRVARVQLEAVDAVADGVVELFLRYVREPLVASGLSKREEAERLVASFRLTLHAVAELVGYNVRRTLLDALQQELDAHGSRAERAAARRLTQAVPA